MSHFIKSGLWKIERVGHKGELDLDNLIKSLLPPTITASNGLTLTSGNITLGGTLTQSSTLIDGHAVQNRALILGSINRLSQFNIFARGAGGNAGVYLEHNDGAIGSSITLASSGIFLSSDAHAFINSPFVSIYEPANGGGFFINSNTFTIQDNFSPAHGLQYAADYSANYTSRSLVDKTYVDLQKLRSFAKASMPSAATTGAGAEIYVTDESGGAVPAFSDGTNWRRVTDRAIVS